jgi:hypothetical protein
MCFSASASFGASAILAIAGVASIKKVQALSQLMFASIPIIFSIQQFTEGFVWLTLTNDKYKDLQNIPIYIFVIFAQVIWPVWVPLSILLVEKNSNRRKVFSVLAGIGLIISIYHIYCLASYHIGATVSPYHINYELDFPLRHFAILGSFYLLTIIMPPLISSIKGMSLIGILLLSSFLISKLYFNDFVISVWCFFAALVSLLVFLIMCDLKAKYLQVLIAKNKWRL